jgi:putative ABC transport system permease protein
VTVIYRPEPRRLISSVEFYVNPATTAGLPAIAYAAVRVRPIAIPALEKTVYSRFPTVSVINVADVIARVQEVVDQIAVVVHFVAFFAVLAGAIILASSVAGTRFRRVREIAVLKTLGATRGRIVRIFSTEFLVLGAVAGLMGGLLATAFSNLLAKRFLHAHFRLELTSNLICLLVTALIATAAGWLASARLLSQKPLDVLRGE